MPSVSFEPTITSGATVNTRSQTASTESARVTVSYSEPVENRLSGSVSSTATKVVCGSARACASCIVDVAAVEVVAAGRTRRRRSARSRRRPSSSGSRSTPTKSRSDRSCSSDREAGELRRRSHGDPRGAERDVRSPLARCVRLAGTPPTMRPPATSSRMSRLVGGTSSWSRAPCRRNQGRSRTWVSSDVPCPNRRPPAPVRHPESRRSTLRATTHFGKPVDRTVLGADDVACASGER